MSPSVRLARPPSAVAVCPGTLEQAFERRLAAECQRAREQGQAEGRSRALAGAGRALESAAERLDAARVEAEQQLSAASVRLAVEIARQVLRAEIRSGTQDLERVVRETLAASGAGRASCAVHLHPEDAQAVSALPFRAGTKIVADPGVSRGSVQVETAQGFLVRDTDELLAAVAARFEQELA